MKLKVILTAAFSLILTLAVFAQDTKTKNFSGSWTLNAAKSELSGEQRIEAITMLVSQTVKELKIVSNTKLAPNKALEANSKRRGAAMSGAGTIETAYTYFLDGKEAAHKSTDGIDSAKLTAEIEKNGQLKLVQTRRFNTPNGEQVLQTVELWLLSPDGKTLTVRRDADVIKGDFTSKKIVTETTEMFFVKGK